MIRVVLIDDEKLCIDELAFYLTKHSDIQILGKYTMFQNAYDFIISNDIDVVFLDISMPRINGLAAAKMIRSEKPNIQVVFVTAHTKYAVDAFEVDSLDYILKPISEERLQKTLKRIRDTKPMEIEPESNMQLRCMKFFEVIKNDGSYLKFRTKKSAELLAYLFHNKNKQLSPDVIIEELWPDLDELNARNMLYTTVYNLKKSLTEIAECNITIEKMNSCYILNTTYQSDADQIEKLLENYEGREPSIEQFDAIKLLYRGDYLDNNGYEWANQKKTFLRRRFVEYCVRLGKKLAESKDFTTATDILRLALSFDPYEDELHFLFIQTLHACNDSVEASQAYQDYCTIMLNELNLKPMSLINILQLYEAK